MDQNDIVTSPDGNSVSGFSALAFVARHLGIETTGEELRRSYIFSGNEPGSEFLVAIAKELGLEAQAMTMEWADLVKSRKLLPAILRLRDGTSLVIERLDESSTGWTALLYDPTTSDARVVVDRARVEEVWGGDIILVKRRFNVSSEEQPFSVRWLLGAMMRERAIFVNVMVAALFATIFTLTPVFIIRAVIDKVIVNKTSSTLEVVTVILLMVIVFETSLLFLQRRFITTIATRLDGRINIYLLEKVLKLPIDYFERTPTGTITSRLHELSVIHQSLTGEVLRTILDAVPALGIIPVLVILDWQIALMVFALVGIIFLIVLFYIPTMRRHLQTVVRANVAKFSHLIETIHGIRTVKSLALESRRRFEWDSLVATSTKARHDFEETANFPATFVTPFERMIYSGTFIVGAFMIINNVGGLEVGQLMAMALLSQRLAAPIVQLAKLQQNLAEMRGAITQIQSVVNEPPEQGRYGTGQRLPVEGNITFQEVRFRYPSATTYALDNASFKIPAGKMFGIMGRSGSGKTTVTRLLQGLHPTYEGTIKIDGMDLREMDLIHLRTNIGVVLQENFLFRGTIRENIAMAKPGATMAEVVRAAQVAGAEEFIERMPQGYNTYLQEGATNLSGGQRQRLAVARALIIDPPVLIFDEATSALDPESEAIINANLHRIAKDRTIICISHRLSMLVPADAIMVLERGQVYDIGRHEELLQRCDIYKHLWNTQNRYTANTPHAQLAIANTTAS